MNPRVEVYALPGCQPCTATKRWLDARGVTHRVRSAEDYAGFLTALGYSQAPVVVIFDDIGAVVAHWSGYRPDLLAAHLGDSPKSEPGVHPLIGDILAAHRQVIPDDAA